MMKVILLYLFISILLLDLFPKIDFRVHPCRTHHLSIHHLHHLQELIMWDLNYLA